MDKCRLIIVAASCLFLAGCPKPVTLKTIVLQPTSVTSGYQTAFAQSWECDVPLPGQGGFLNGLGPEPSNAGEAPSGFDDIYNHGADPFQCNEQEQILYRGHVQFDLSQFDDPVSATLNITSVRSTQNVQPQSPPQCVATILGMSTGTRDDGQGPYFWDYDNDASIGGPIPPSACQTIINPLFAIGVSNQVRQWMTQQHFNWGFIIAGPNLGPPSVPSDNNGAVTFYSGFQLSVLYNPALNPRAPQ
jgi:hypothetical protein